MVACRNCFYQLPSGVMLCNLCGAVTPNDPVLGDSKSVTKDMIVDLGSEIKKVQRLDIGEGFNEAWGGGLVPTSTTLFGALPGTGKTTSCLQICARVTKQTGRHAIYISAEQGADEVGMTADRLGLLPNPLIKTIRQLGPGGSIDETVFAAYPPAIIVLDSLNAVCGQDVHLAIGVAKAYKGYALKYNVPVIMIGHMVKNVDFAGLMRVQHDVDALMVLEYDKLGRLVILAAKNRYGPAGTDYPLEMTARGIVSAKKDDRRDQKVSAERAEEIAQDMESLVLDGEIAKIRKAFAKKLLKDRLTKDLHKKSLEELAAIADGLIDLDPKDFSPRGKHADRGDKPKSKRRQKKTA